jgi:xylan 1,4-beta-xylosidase
MLFALVALAFGWSTVSAGESETDAGERITIVVDADREPGELYNFWNVFPETVQAPFKDEAKHEELRKLYPFAKYINCVRFLGGIDLKKDDYFRGAGSDGQAICDFTEAIALLSGIRKCGYTPWIVLDNVPAAMSANPTENKYGNTEPPADFKVWAGYVRQLVRTLVEEFGRDEVCRWRFRVGTEPDLSPGHWSGTKEQYLAHYDHTVEAVLSVLPDADIGPGNILDPVKNARRAWGLEIIDHCATGKNYATGQTGTPLKFFACSYYTAVGVPNERFGEVIGMVRNRLARYPQFTGVPVEIHEFGILSEGGKLLAGDGTEFGGSWTAHMARKIYTLGVPRVYQWYWNTTKAGGLPIPVTHVLGMLEEMAGGNRLSVRTSRDSETDDIGCIAARKDNTIGLLLYRHRAVRDNGEPADVHVALEGEIFADRDWRIERGDIIDRERSGFIHEQRADLENERQAMGEDASPLAAAIRVMAKHRGKYERMSKLSPIGRLPDLTVDEGGRLCFGLSLEGHCVVYLRLVSN